MNHVNIADESVFQLKDMYTDKFFVLWILGNQCTYKCSYCPDHFHNGKIKYQPLEIIKDTFSKLPSAHVMFTGGEATFHPDFEEIVLTKPNHISLSVISNASRPIGFWERISDKLNTVMLTFHAEFAALDRFTETAKLVYIENKRYGRINVTMIPERWSECVNAVERLKNEGLRVSAKPLVENFGYKADKVLSTYTNEQLRWISKSNQQDSFKNIGLYDKDNNLLYKTNPSELISQKQNNFNGWLCYTNTKCLYIDGDGTVFDTACQQRLNKGNIYKTFNISSQPIVCSQNFCWCHSDIGPKKIKIYATDS